MGIDLSPSSEVVRPEPRSPEMHPRAIFGRVRGFLSEGLDRILHDRRRARAKGTLAEFHQVERVLFVCHGNIYRSPFAAAIFESRISKKLNRSIAVVSGGFVGSGRPAPPEAVRLAAALGLDLASHRSRVLQADMIIGADLVVVMAQRQKREICRRFGYPSHRVLVLGDLDPGPVRSREIVDPWNQPPHILEASARRIERCITELVGMLGSAGPHPF
jgi:protein-tyrosine phosphatase